MDCIRIIHLSDLHFGEGNVEDEKHEDRLTSFYTLLSNMRTSVTKNVKFHVAITGDFLDKYDAKPENSGQYAQMFKDFIMAIMKYGDIHPDSFVFCLGNHDKSKKEYLKLLEKIRGKDSPHDKVTFLEKVNGMGKSDRIKIKKGDVDDNIISGVLSESFPIFFNPYKVVGEQCSYPKISSDEDSFMAGVKIIDRVKYISFNSSWFCAESIPTLDDDKKPLSYMNKDGATVVHKTTVLDHGNLSLGKTLTRGILNYADAVMPDLFTVGLIHHNVRSLSIDNHHDKKGKIALVADIYKHCSLLLSGHEHGELDSDLSGLSCYTSCSGTFYSKEDSLNGNTFSTIDIFFDTQQIKKTIYTYCEEKNMWEDEELDLSEVNKSLEFPEHVKGKILNYKIEANEYYIRTKHNILLKEEFYKSKYIFDAQEFLQDDFKVERNAAISDFRSFRDCNTLQAYVEQHNLVRSKVMKKIYENTDRSLVRWIEPFGLDQIVDTP